MKNTKVDHELRPIQTSALSSQELEALGDVPLLDPPTLDEAIIGTMQNTDGESVLVYSYEKLIDCVTQIVIEDRKASGLVEEDGEESSPSVDAQEDVDHNTIPLLAYLGPRAPIVLSSVDDEIIEETEIPASDVIEYKGAKWTRVR